MGNVGNAHNQFGSSFHWNKLFSHRAFDWKRALS